MYEKRGFQYMTVSKGVEVYIHVYIYDKDILLERSGKTWCLWRYCAYRTSECFRDKSHAKSYHCDKPFKVLT